jgi:hypothetical protein
MKYTTVCVQKKLIERHIAEAVEMFSQNRRIRNETVTNNSEKRKIK